MPLNRLVSTLTLAAFLSAGLTPPVAAADPVPRSDQAAPSPLRASIDRAASGAQFPRVPARRQGTVRRQMMPGGGGGGGGMMLMTLLVTAASLAGTYFLVKELKKSSDDARTAQ